MSEDVLRALGYATLGSRLKRIGEVLQAQTQTVAAELAGADLPTPHNPVLAALDRQGPLSIGDLAKAIGQSQPGVTRMINKMKSDGLVEASASHEDRRVTTIELTDKGEALVAHLKETLWPAITLAVADACDGLEGPLLGQLAALEDALAMRPLSSRCKDKPLQAWSSLQSPPEGAS
jgi:DNA-binding MarR family transcriptional regulator